MKEIILDFTGINSLWNLHESFKKVFKLPDYYGNNMDALWDCLHCSFEFPTTIVLKNIEKIPSEMREAVEIMLELFCFFLQLMHIIASFHDPIGLKPKCTAAAPPEKDRYEIFSNPASANHCANTFIPGKSVADFWSQEYSK